MTGLCFFPLPICAGSPAAIDAHISQPTKTTPAEAPTTLFMKSLRFGIISPLAVSPHEGTVFSALLCVPCGKPSKNLTHRTQRKDDCHRVCRQCSGSGGKSIGTHRPCR